MVKMPELFRRLAVVVTVMITVGEVATATAAGLAEAGQPSAETDGDPLGKVERLEQHLLHPLERRRDRFHHADFARTTGS